jgi:L-asparaginase/Glu-tRNA(Gln) amidotransferase subunit D
VKGASEDQSEEQEGQEGAEAGAIEEGQMTEEQARRLLQSMKDEEQRVQLGERRRTSRVYKDW